MIACRRAWAASMATPQLAMRDRTLSARLVRMMGTRAPRTTPALSALARKLSCLASMFPASRSGASRMSGSPATSDVMPLVLAASLLMALSKASGPSSRPPVICLAVGHLAERGRVDRRRHLRRDGLDRRENRDLRRLRRRTRCARSIAFWHDVHLVVERRRDVDRRVGDDQDLVVRRHVHDEHVAEAPARAKAGFPCDDGAEQFVGVEAPLHQQFRFAVTHELDGLRRRCVTVGRIDDPCLAEHDAGLLRDLPDLRRGSDQNRDDQPLLTGLDRPGQRSRIARMRHGGRDGLETAAAFEERFVLAGSCHGSCPHSHPPRLRAHTSAPGCLAGCGPAAGPA